MSVLNLRLNLSGLIVDPWFAYELLPQTARWTEPPDSFPAPEYDDAEDLPLFGKPPAGGLQPHQSCAIHSQPGTGTDHP